jgi:hypothetical protein
MDNEAITNFGSAYVADFSGFSSRHFASSGLR